MGKPRPLVFLDRDGVLNELVLDTQSRQFESPYRAADVVVSAEAIAAVRLLRRTNAVLAVVSNQPSAAKGTTTLEELAKVDRAVQEAFADAGLAFDLVVYCWHHPDGIKPELAGKCDCRKPAPGLLLRAMDELGVEPTASLWMIGDSDVDISAGLAVGATTILVEEPRSAHRRSGSPLPDHRTQSVLSAAELVVTRIGHPTRGGT